MRSSKCSGEYNFEYFIFFIFIILLLFVTRYNIDRTINKIETNNDTLDKSLFHKTNITLLIITSQIFMFMMVLVWVVFMQMVISGIVNTEECGCKYPEGNWRMIPKVDFKSIVHNLSAFNFFYEKEDLMDNDFVRDKGTPLQTNYDNRFR